MIIGNVKSNQDLESKRNLQKEILALEVSNEEENQRRRKQAGIQSYEPAKILAQYKTSAEIQSDRMSAEGEARKHLDELGFGFQDANKIVAWLSSSIINRLTDFNANAKGIKSEIKNNFSPTAYTNVQFIENFLERYFDDLDVNYGKKFGLTPVQQPAKTIDELQKILPNRNALEQLKSALVGYANTVETEEDRDRATLILDKIDILISCSLSPQMISQLKTLLSQNERTKFSKRVSNVARRMNFISTKEIQEITGQIESRLGRRRNELPAIIFKLEKLIANVGGKGFVNLTEFTEKFLQEVGLVNKPEYQESGLAREIEDNNELTEINLKKLNADEEMFLQLKTPRVPSLTEARYNSEIGGGKDPISILHDIEENGFTKLQAVYRGRKARKDNAVLGKQAESILEEMIRDTVRLAITSQVAENLVKEIFEDITGNVDKSMTEEEMKEEIKQFLVEDPTAPERIDTLLEAVREEQASIELEEPSIEQSIQLEQNEYRVRVEQYLKELKEGKNTEEYKRAMRLTLKEGLNVSPNEYKNLGVNALEELVKRKYSEMNPLTRASRNEYKPEGVTIGLGLRRQRINEKLAKHFKEDEKLLKKIAKKMSEDSSSSSESEEEEEKLLKGHIRRSVKADRAIEHSLKGEGVQYLPKSQRDAIYSGLKKIGLGSGKVDNNTFGGAGVGFHAKRIPINKVGKGVDISEEENPTYRTFGKYRIHIPQLLNNNTANFKYPSLGSIPTLKPQTISQDYKEFLIDLLNNGKFSDRDLKRLPQREIRHFERVAIGAGLVEKFGIKVGDNDEDRKDAERFEILKGEYLAGNNNEKMIKELRQLIVKFINSGRLIKSEGMNLLLQISTL